MGQVASKVWGSVVRRPLQRYNVEDRAHKLADKMEDPSAAPLRAPMYKSDASVLDHVRENYPEVAKQTKRHDSELHERLKSVYVESRDPEAPQGKSTQSTKKLPKDIHQYSVDFVPAQLRQDTPDRAPRTIQRGKVSLDQAVKFLTRHKETSGTFGHEAIASEYRLNPSVTKDALTYFHIFSMHVPKVRETELTKPDPLIAKEDWVKKITKKGIEPAPFKDMDDQIKMMDSSGKRQGERIQREKDKMLDRGKDPDS